MIAIRDSGERYILSNSSGMLPLANLLCMGNDEKRLVWVEREDDTYDVFGTGWALAMPRRYGTDSDIVFMPITGDICNYIDFAPVERYGITYACYDHRPMKSELPWFKKECAGAMEQPNEQLPS